MYNRAFWVFISILLIVGGVTKIYAPTLSQGNAQQVPTKKHVQIPFGGFEVSIGQEHAPLTIVMYYSLTCPHCHEYQEKELPKIQRDFIDKGLVRFIFRDFPTDLVALKAAKIAWCHGKTQYLSFARKLLATQDKWVLDPSEKTLHKIGLDLGISQQDLEKCTSQDTDTEKTIMKTCFEAQKTHEIMAAPAFIINGKVYDGIPNAEDIGKLLLKMGIHA